MVVVIAILRFFFLNVILVRSWDVRAGATCIYLLWQHWEPRFPLESILAQVWGVGEWGELNLSSPS